MEKNEIWETPSEPYFFKNSSRFQGKFLESFIFNDSEIFYQLEARPVRQEGDALSRHIKFLILASKELESEKICPFCGGAKIKFLLFLNYSTLDLKLSSCENSACKEAVKAGRPESRLIPLNLNGLRQFKGKTIRKKAELVFRQAFGVKKNASPIEIFNKFNEAYLKMKKRELENESSLETGRTSTLTIGPGKAKGHEFKKEDPPFYTRYYSGRKSDAKQIKLFS
ncbi:hypothetical protein JXK06_01045 [Patescibacteria group bacterium]|nr:hypothetical protein [Patescibacteria group bacterium]